MSELSSSSSSSNSSEDSETVEEVPPLPPMTGTNFVLPKSLLQVNKDDDSDDSFEALLNQLCGEKSEDFFFPKLEKFCIKNISFSTFSAGFLRRTFSSKELLEVDISGCLDSDEAASQFTDQCLRDDSQLKKLALNNTINLRGETWKSLLIFILSKFTQLECIEIADCYLNESRFNAIIEVIEELDHPVILNELVLSRNPKLSHSLRRFVFSLTQSTNLRL